MIRENCYLNPCDTVQHHDCCVRDCGRYKPKKLNQLKKSEFTKELFYVQECPDCHEEIRLSELPKLNQIINCESCDAEYEISSVYNYIEKDGN